MILPHHVKAQRPVQIEGGNLPRIDVLFASGHVFLHQCPDGLGDARPLSGLFYILVDPDASVLAFDRWHFTLRVEGAYHDKARDWGVAEVQYPCAVSRSKLSQTLRLAASARKRRELCDLQNTGEF